MSGKRVVFVRTVLPCASCAGSGVYCCPPTEVVRVSCPRCGGSGRQDIRKGEMRPWGKAQNKIS